MSDIQIRPAEPRDSQALVAILTETFHDTWAPQMTPASIARYDIASRAPAYVSEKEHAFVVATLNGAVAGLIHWQDDFVHALHLSAAYRRRGIASRLMATAEAAMRQTGQVRVLLETDTFNVPSQALYRALGFREIDRYPDVEYDPSITTVLLEKRLD